MDFYKVDFAKKADRDLDGISAYLQSQSVSRWRALKFADAIRSEINHRLSFWPQGYRLVDDDILAARGQHKLIVKNYLVFFTVDEEKNTAFVERIIHGKRDWITIMRGDDETESTDKQF